VYERAVANLPPGADKRFWRRYIYLWIKYALFEELDAGDVERAREVYRCVRPSAHAPSVDARGLHARACGALSRRARLAGVAVVCAR
jgi:hypothetical protein